MKPKYIKTRERGWCWVCQYGNIITTSTVSAEECYRKHIRKLYGLCFNVEQIERNIDFINRHITKLKTDNKALAGDILEWKDRNKLNAGVRKLASVTKIYFGKMWNELYKNLQYKYGISLKRRGDKPYIQHVKQEEWKFVIMTFSAMCEAYGQSPSDMFQQATPKKALKTNY